MSSGYDIYSLDWGKFQGFVNQPTDKQLSVFAKRIGEELETYDFEIDEDDPVQDWSGGTAELRELIIERLALSDWYSDLSDAGKEIWSQAVWGFCCHERLSGVGFRAHGSVYWDLLEIAWKELKVEGERILPDVALSAFGRCPYRYHPAASGDGSVGDGDFGAWRPMHSMHTPDEVPQMLKELQSVAPAIASSKKKDVINDYDVLMPVLEKLAKEKRMLFVQVNC